MLNRPPQTHSHSSSEIRQRLRHRPRRLPLNDAKIIPSFIILEPRRRLIARIRRNVRVSQLLDPRLLVRHGVVPRTRFPDAEMLVVRLCESVVEGAVGAGEGGAGPGVDV